MRPHGAEAWRGVLKLRNLNLQLRLLGSGAIGKDVQDHFAAVDHFEFERLLQFSNLTGSQFIVKDHYFGTKLLAHGREFFHLALANVGLAARRNPALLKGAHHTHPGCFRQCL